MGLVSNLRGSRTEAAPQQEALPVSAVSGGAAKRKWTNLMPLVVALVVVAEIAFLGRLDMAKNAEMVDTLAVFFYRPRAVVEGDDLGLGTVDDVEKILVVLNLLSNVMGKCGRTQ